MIPAIDLRAGQLVRLEQGDYARETVYDRNPGERARRFAALGASRIHVVDLDGARDGEAANERSIRDILAAVGGVPIQLGGGIRTLERVETVLSWGVDRVILGTLLLEDPELVREIALRNPNKVVLGLDARDGRLAVRGWRETAELQVESLLEHFAELPLAAVLYTDVSRDGLLEGPNVQAAIALAEKTPHPVIASGGVGSVDHLLELARSGVLAGAVVGRALYTGAVDLGAALERLASC